LLGECIELGSLTVHPVKQINFQCLKNPNYTCGLYFAVHVMFAVTKYFITI